MVTGNLFVRAIGDYPRGGKRARQARDATTKTRGSTPTGPLDCFT